MTQDVMFPQEDLHGFGAPPAYDGPYRDTDTSTSRLVFPRGAARVMLRADSGLDRLYHASFFGNAPEVEEHDGTVRITYKWPFWSLRGGLATVTLRGNRTWDLDLEGGVSQLAADLGALTLRSMSIGGASNVALRLGVPRGTTRVAVRGGASGFALLRPMGVAVRITVRGGTSRARLDDFELGAVGGRLHWETPGLRGESASL